MIDLDSIQPRGWGWASDDVQPVLDKMNEILEPLHLEMQLLHVVHHAVYYVEGARIVPLGGSDSGLLSEEEYNRLCPACGETDSCEWIGDRFSCEKEDE